MDLWPLAAQKMYEPDTGKLWLKISYRLFSIQIQTVLISIHHQRVSSSEKLERRILQAEDLQNKSGSFEAALFESIRTWSFDRYRFAEAHPIRSFFSFPKVSR